MKLIIIVDDRKEKQEAIRDLILSIYPDTPLLKFDSVAPAMECVRSTYIDKINENPLDYLIISDMQMPMASGGQVLTDGGIKFLKRLQNIGCNCPVIVVSSEPVNEVACKEAYSEYAGQVLHSFYRTSTSDYKVLLDAYYSEKAAGAPN